MDSMVPTKKFLSLLGFVVHRHLHHQSNVLFK
jgi:hypothetical protein